LPPLSTHRLRPARFPAQRPRNHRWSRSSQCGALPDRL